MDRDSPARLTTTTPSWVRHGGRVGIRAVTSGQNRADMPSLQPGNTASLRRPAAPESVVHRTAGTPSAGSTRSTGTPAPPASGYPGIEASSPGITPAHGFGGATVFFAARFFGVAGAVSPAAWSA